LDLYGLEMDELRRADATTLRPDIQTDGTPSAALAARLTARALAGEPCAANWVVRAADGRETPCEVRLVRLPAPGRRLLRVSLLDMSERRRMEERERAIAEDLRQAQKLQAVAKLTGGLAHEFNNLLTVVKGNLELLSEDLEESGQQGLLQAASHATLRAIDLTQRLLAFSGHQALRTESVSLREHLRETLPALERAMGAGVRIELDLAEGLWSVEVDALGLENALLNLALNARDAMPRGGRIVMRAANRRVEISGVAAWGLHAAGDYVEVEVEDEGVGIAPDDLPRVTEPFFTTKGVGQGSGLGLSSVHGFVLQSGGGLRIESTPGLGTRVRFVLPRAQAAVRAPVARARAAAQGGGGETLLIVEDDPAVRAFTRTMFERAGYDVIAVADAPTALGVLATQPGVALLFTDVVLPGGVSGLALAQQVRRDHPRIPILFTSGYAEGDLGRVAGEDLPLEVLPKPFDRQHVLARVRSLLDSEARP
ncbi:MAG: response regulator, partial [Gemmatimonadetes bacterium]